VGRTVRTGHADRPACCSGLSAHTPRTVRPFAADHLKKQTEPPETTPNNGPSAGSTRTVRQAPADCPPSAADYPKPCPTKTQSHDGSKAKLSKNTKNTGRTRSSRIVRRSLADCPRLTDRPENSPTSKVNSPKSLSDFPNGRSCGDKGLGTCKASHKDAIAQKSCLLTPEITGNRESFELHQKLEHRTKILESKWFPGV
jgi:hypothetical protein